MPSSYHHRKMTDDDRHYIMLTWSASMRPLLPAIHRKTAERIYRGEVDRLLRRTEVIVACLPDTPEIILGWAAASPKTLHYVYVKSAYRRLGIGRYLATQLGAPDLVMSCLTPDGLGLALALGMTRWEPRRFFDDSPETGRPERHHLSAGRPGHKKAAGRTPSD